MAPPPVIKINMTEMNAANQQQQQSRDDSNNEESGVHQQNFKYVSLINHSTASFDSSLSTSAVNEKNAAAKLERHNSSSNSDQKLPELNSCSSSISISNTNQQQQNQHQKQQQQQKWSEKKKSMPTRGQSNNLQQQTIEFSDFANLDRSPLSSLNGFEFKVKQVQPLSQQMLGQSVPNCSRLPSNASLNTMTNISLGGNARRVGNGNGVEGGQMVLNPVNLSYHLNVVDDGSDDYEDGSGGAQDESELNYSHIKYMNLFSLICCWCFPFTGIFSVVYMRLARKHFLMRDKETAKKYLAKSEWLLMLTFFFGLTLLAVTLAILDAYFVRHNIASVKSSTANRSQGNLMAHIFH